MHERNGDISCNKYLLNISLSICIGPAATGGEGCGEGRASEGLCFEQFFSAGRRASLGFHRGREQLHRLQRFSGREVRHRIGAMPNLALLIRGYDDSDGAMLCWLY